MIEIRVTRRSLNETSRLKSALVKLRSTLTNFERVNAQMKQYMIREWVKNFNSEGDLYGGWEGLAEWTAEDRIGEGVDPYHPILVRQGALFNSFVDQSHAGNVRKDGVFWHFTNDPSTGAYPVFHSLGGPNPLGAGDIPARPIWDIQEGIDDEQYVQLILADVGHKLKQAGF